MSTCPPRPIVLAALLIAWACAPAAAQNGSGATPGLQVTRQGDSLSFQLTDNPGGFWVLQSSAEAGDWEDLVFLDGNDEASASASWWDGPSRIFRARRLDTDDRVLRDFLNARITWRNAGIDSYTMFVDRHASFLFWRGNVTVTDNQVTSADPVETNYFEPPPPRTIDDWFDHLKQIIDQDPYELEVTYDPVHGFPASAMVDRSVQIADDEEGWSIQNFQVQP